MISTRFAVAICLVILFGGTLEVNTAGAQGTIYLDIVAEQDYASSDPLAPFDILFIAYANGNRVQGMIFDMELHFSNGNILGVIDEYPNGEAQVVWSPTSVTAFASRALNPAFGQHPTSPDTMSMGLTSFGQPWKGSGEVFRMRVTPKDTGSVEFAQGWFPGAVQFPEFLDPTGSSIPSSIMGNPVIHVPPQPGAVRFRISTSSGTDTLFFGMPGTIYFNVDAMGNQILGLDFGFKWVFSNGNFVGPFSDVSGEVQYSPATLAAYESITFGPYAPNGTNPDTCLVGLLDFGGDNRFSGSTWMWSVTFQPMDTGTVLIDSNFLHPPAWVNIHALGFLGGPLPSSFIPGRIVVLPCPYSHMGDVNQDAVITSSDLIYFINYVFKSGPDPLPDRSIGDVNCSGGLGGSDIIYLVNYIFKSGAAPCGCIVKRI